MFQHVLKRKLQAPMIFHCRALCNTVPEDGSLQLCIPAYKPHICVCAPPGACLQGYSTVLMLNEPLSSKSCNKLTCSHVLHNADAKVFIQHGVQAPHSAPQQAADVLKGGIGAELHTVLQA